MTLPPWEELDHWRPSDATLECADRGAREAFLRALNEVEQGDEEKESLAAALAARMDPFDEDHWLVSALRDELDRVRLERDHPEEAKR
jgi:hypothetical protein